MSDSKNVGSLDAPEPKNIEATEHPLFQKRDDSGATAVQFLTHEAREWSKESCRRSTR